MQCPDNVEDSPVVAPEEVASMNVFTRDLDGEKDCHLADLTGSTDLEIQTSASRHQMGLREGCLVVNEFVCSLVGDLLLLAIHGVEKMSRAPIL